MLLLPQIHGMQRFLFNVPARRALLIYYLLSIIYYLIPPIPPFTQTIPFIVPLPPHFRPVLFNLVKMHTSRQKICATF